MVRPSAKIVHWKMLYAVWFLIWGHIGRIIFLTIEFAHMNLVQTSSTGVTPFEVDTGKKERRPMLIIEDCRNALARNFASYRQHLIEKATSNLHKAQERMKKYYDVKRITVMF